MLPVFVVHAKSLTDRVASIESEVASVGLPFSWIDQFDPEEITSDSEAQWFSPGHELSRPQMSCALKHIVALQRVSLSKETHLILEDDVGFRRGARASLEACLSEFPHGDQAVAYVSCGPNRYTPARLLKQGQMLYPAKNSRTTDAYLITPTAARERLKHITYRKIGNPIDHAFSRLDRAIGTKILWAEPPFAYQKSITGEFRSAISSKRKHRTAWRIAAGFYGKRLLNYYVKPALARLINR